MKLSHKKKFGAVHVKAKRLVRVVKAHPVSTKGENLTANKHDGDLFGREKPELRRGVKQVFAQPRDLAIEVVYAKSGNRLGYSYLSGDPAQIMSYADADDVWFEDATSAVVDIPEPDLPCPGDEMQGMMPIFEALMEAKYGGHDVVVFDKKVPVEDVEDAGRSLAQLWGYEDTRKDPVSVHLIGSVHGPKKKGRSVFIHVQPEEHASDRSASTFQLGLLLAQHGVVL